MQDNLKDNIHSRITHRDSQDFTRARPYLEKTHHKKKGLVEWLKV
jgi:hypothetical protein